MTFLQPTGTKWCWFRLDLQRRRRDCTNNHVIEGPEKIVVRLADSRTFNTDNVYRDPSTNLAIVKINATDLPAVQVGDSSGLRVGDWVVAIGNPLGQGLRAKEGVVSGTNEI